MGTNWNPNMHPASRAVQIPLQVCVCVCVCVWRKLCNHVSFRKPDNGTIGCYDFEIPNKGCVWCVVSVLKQ